LNKLLPFLAFSILLLVPIGVQQVFAEHTPFYTGTTGHCDLTINPPVPIVDYRNCDLSGANFADFDLTQATFTRANVVGADFSGANLHNSRFIFSNAAGANFANSDMSAIIGSLSDFSGADFSGADFLGADFSAQAPGLTDFTRADLSNIDFGTTDFTNVDLSFVTLSDTNNLGSAGLGGIIIRTLSCGSGTTQVGNECDPDVTQAQHDAALAAVLDIEAQRDAILTTLFEFLRVFGVI